MYLYFSDLGIVLKLKLFYVVHEKMNMFLQEVCTSVDLIDQKSRIKQIPIPLFSSDKRYISLNISNFKHLVTAVTYLCKLIRYGLSEGTHELSIIPYQW